MSNKQIRNGNNIENLPDFHALQKLASSLWKREGAYQGSAIMVGAGFSRSAAKTGDSNKKMPIWSDLSAKLAKDIGADGAKCTDALRLAEEYYAYHGKQALNDLLKQEVNDSAWEVTELYNTLLTLPWSEVLTTNWDTLLERAANNIHEPIYSTVNKQADLASSESPRIVKLHGTIEVTDNLIFKQEDYRRYHQTHAAFVNFARHVFIENELCLIGFSGDDPNFLQWAGWVRDNLSNDARRIYLVGALNLTMAKRKYLESIGVSPIDLYPLVIKYDDRDERHLKATELFLDYLHSQKPKQKWEWQPTRLKSQLEKQELVEQIAALIKDRGAYPEWLICPPDIRSRLQNQVFIPKKNIVELPEDKKAQLLYELIWRNKVTDKVTQNWIVELLMPFLDVANHNLSQNQKAELAIHLLKYSRWLAEGADDFSLKISTWIEQYVEVGSEYINEVNYHYALVARDDFDYVKLETFIAKLSEKDPVWKLRKAGLLAELGEFERGGVLVKEAFNELQRQHRNDKKSVFVLSRLAWAHWFYRIVNYSSLGGELIKTPLSYKQANTDPWDFIQDLRNRTQKELESQQRQNSIETLFEPGSYKDHSQSSHLINETHPLILFYELTAKSGIPIRWNNFNLLSDSAGKFILLGDVDENQRFSLALRAANSDTDEVLKKSFSRIYLAKLRKEVANRWIDICFYSIKFWLDKCAVGVKEQKNYALARLRVFIEVLARLQIRATPDKAIEVFKLGLSIGQIKNCRYRCLFDALNHLITYSLDAIPVENQHEIFEEALHFPLNRELQLASHENWPNPKIHSFPKGQSPEIAVRIDKVIDLISPCTEESSSALIRLLPMLEKSYLSKEQREKISERIWGVNPDYSIIPQTGLLNYVLLMLPNFNKVKVKEVIQDSLFEQESNEHLFNSSLFVDIVNAAQSKTTHLMPSDLQALNYFKRLVAWRAAEDNSDHLGLIRDLNKELSTWIGSTLSYSIVPSLSNANLTLDNFNELKVFFDEVYAPSSVIAFVYFANVEDSLKNFVEKQLIQGLQSQDHSYVSHSAHAILKWYQLAGKEVVKKLLIRLIYLMESGRTVGLSSIIWTLSEVYKLNGLSSDEVKTVIHSIYNILDATEYQLINPDSREAVSVSLIRKECVKFIKVILNNEENKSDQLEETLDRLKNDALPEVRFA